ncbi:hypothetical protein ACIQZO_02190 [Streptomyces sp. NPDC097617]|uniref:hypothetical protein n=1 Tax=Streptomyces sp. NPDC097617 TaxID=3366091 RepID=UPI0037FFB089
MPAAVQYAAIRPRTREGAGVRETCPGPGATIGPAMTFGWAAANAIAAELG